MLYPWVILSLADLLAVNLSPAILVDRSWQSLKSCLPFLERPRRCCPCPWFWPDFHQDLCESPSTDILASFHGWSGVWDLGFLFKTWSQKKKKIKKDLESPLHAYCQIWEVPAVLRFSISLYGFLLLYSNTPSTLLCSPEPSNPRN